MIPDERETRLFSASVAASVALHAVALTLGPHLRTARVEPPHVLSVVLAEVHAPEVLPEEAAPRPPKPEVPRARARPKPAPVPAPPVSEPAPVAAPEPPAAAVVPRESLVAPDFRAAYLNNPPPPYPRSARRSGEQGTVTLRVHVATDGVPTRVELERSSGSPTLDEAALEAVKTWRFVPARRGTDPVAAWVIVPVIFRLTPGS
jgi:protein TonB